GSTPLSRLWARRRIHASLAAAFGVYVLLRVVVIGSIGAPAGFTIRTLENPLVGASLGARLGTAMWGLAEYCALLVLPVRLSADYSFDQIPLVTSWNDLRLATGAVLMATTCAVAGLTWRRHRAIATLLLTFLLLWLPVSNIVLPIGTIMAERLMYL